MRELKRLNKICQLKFSHSGALYPVPSPALVQSGRHHRCCDHVNKTAASCSYLLSGALGTVATLEAVGRLINFLSPPSKTASGEAMGRSGDSDEIENEELEEGVFVVEKLLDMKWVGNKQKFLVRKYGLCMFPTAVNSTV